MTIGKSILFLFSILFVLSIGLNSWFLSGKGIIINQDKRVTNHQEQYQQQWQGQLLLNMWTAQGDKIIWEAKSMKDFKTTENYLRFKESLHPLSSMFAEVVPFYPSDTITHPGYYELYLTWPNVFKKTKEKQILDE